MRLIIGGASQGKLDWYLSQQEYSQEEVSDGAEISLEELPQGKILNHFHRWVFRLLEQGIDPKEKLEAYLAKQPDAVILSDEIGCGVVPIAASEREWRETAGRLCCDLAKRAKRVDRIFCGLAMPLKKEN